jgi:hypothetical protein
MKNLDAEEYLGGGTYGNVIKSGNKAVKIFNRRNAMIQEYAACMALKGIPYVINCESADIVNSRIIYPLYKYDLKKFY